MRSPMHDPQQTWVHHSGTMRYRALGVTVLLLYAHLNLIHELHCLDDAHGLSLLDLVTDVCKQWLSWGRAAVEGSGHWAADFYAGDAGWGRGLERQLGPGRRRL